MRQSFLPATLRKLLLPLLLCAWGVAMAQEPVEDGEYYLIKNENNGGSYYLVPSTRCHGSNPATPYLRTAMGTREASVWKIQLDGSDATDNFYNIIHAVDGKYVMYNKYKSNLDTVVHLETVADVSALGTRRDSIRFRFIKTTNDNYGIVPLGVNRASGQDNSFNPYSGNGHATKGEIGLYRYNSDASSRWIFIKTTAPLTIAYNAGATPTFSISCVDGGVSIYYTTDGSDPMTSPTRAAYSGPVAAEGVSILRATAEKTGCQSVVYNAYNPEALFVIEHMANPGFFMIPHATAGTSLNSSSLMRPDMAIRFEEATMVGGMQYYNLHFIGDDTYMHMTSDGTVSLKPAAELTADKEFCFRFDYNPGVGYQIIAMSNPGRNFYKDDNNDYNKTVTTSNGHDNRTAVKAHWNLVGTSAFPNTNAFPGSTLPFTLSDDACASYIRIANANATAYYIIPPTGGSAYATTSNAGDVNDRWFVRKVASDEWLDYYAFVNALTGQCLTYNGVAPGSSSAAFETSMLTVSEMATNANAQFAIAVTSTSASDGRYYIVPKPARLSADRTNYHLIWRDGSILKLQAQRGDNDRKWLFETSSFTCDVPEITYDAVQGTVTITSPNNAPIYYIGYNDGDPAITPATGTLYTGPFDVQHTHYKAIAARCTDGSDASATTTYDLAEPFRCATPVVTYNTSTQQVTITCATASATIYYTVGGATPTSASTVYTGPFTITEPQVIKAIAIRGSDASTASDITTYDRIPRFISSTAEIVNLNGAYAAQVPFTVTGTIGTESQPFTGEFDGAFVPLTLSAPLFGYVDGGTVKNVRVATLSNDLSGTNVGAIVNEASGDAKIYNCGVLDSTHTVSATNAAGGIVGHIASGASVKVVNCYNYATVAGSVYSGGIVGYNESDVANGTRIALCMMYGDMTTGTNRSPVYYGGHTSNNRNYTEYNFWRIQASLTYTAYNDQIAIANDEYLTRFPFYRHILNTHRELAALFVFGDTRTTTTATAPTADEVDEIGHWVVMPDVAQYPIIEPWEKNTTRTLSRTVPATTERYAGRKLADITADKVYRGDGTQVTTMGTNGMLRVNYSIGGTTGYVDLPITDMDTLNYDFTWGKVVLPFANEFSGWTRDYSKICTGWKITSVTGGTAGTLTNYNFADRDCTAKDLYANSGYIFAQGGNYIVPYGVTAINIEAHFANAFYLSDAQADYGYDAGYANQTDLGWTVPTTYHGQTVYTDLKTLLIALSSSSTPHNQAIVLVGNYHYNQKTITGNTVFPSYTSKGITIMSVDEDNNQEPDYGWYTFQSNEARTDIAPVRFDFVPNIGIGMAARVTNSGPNPSQGIWHCHGWFEITETSLVYMSECEINSASFNSADDGHGNNRWIVNGGYFEQIIRAFDGNDSRLSYVQIGGNAYVYQYYPSAHITKSHWVGLRPINVTGGEIQECFQTGNHSTAQGTDIHFWCAGGRIHKYLSAFTTNITTETTNVTAKVDHALIRRFFGGGTSAAAPITGNITIAMNNSRVNFFCGGPEFGDMTDGKTVTTTAYGSIFGEYYGAGFGGTSLTTRYITEKNDCSFGGNLTFPLAWNNYKRLSTNSYSPSLGLGVGYSFDFIPYSGGTGSGVARFYTKFAKFSLAQTGDVSNTLSHCVILTDYYGAGCQGTVAGTVTSTLTDCAVTGSAFGGGYKASANTLEVYPTTQPTYASYTKETGTISPFGTVEPETWNWAQGTEDTYDNGSKTIYTSTDMSTLGTVTGAISLTIGGNSTVGGNVFGGGNESPSNNSTAVTLRGNTQVLGDVYGGGNKANVVGKSEVRIEN